MNSFFRKIKNKLFLNDIKHIIKENNSLIESKVQEKIDSFYELIIKNELYKRLDSLSFDINGRLCTNISRLFSAYSIHQQTFSQFKGVNHGKDVVIVGAGPTVNSFKPIKNVVYIGLNRAFKIESILFDYLFAIDKAGIKNYYKEFFSYQDGKCIKFIGDQNNGESYQIPESVIVGDKIFRYITTAGQFLNRFTYHIESEPLGNFQSVSLQAMQFALYTNPAKIYLVGIDCSPNGHFTGKTEFSESRTEEEFKNNMKNSIEDWKKCKQFVKTYYPDTEIISVNPVGLKGIFNDWYQSEGGESK